MPAVGAAGRTLSAELTSAGSPATRRSGRQADPTVPEPSTASDRPAPQAADDGPLPLAGYTVAVATDRRHHPIAAYLDRYGARTVSVQATRTVAQADPDDLAAATRLAVEGPADEVVVSSAFGLRCWLATARSLGVADELVGRFAGARLLARDGRAADGLRELGLTEIWSTASATTEDLFAYLLAQPMAGRRVLAQLDGEPVRELCLALAETGADVVPVRTYRLQPPNHRDVLRRLADQMVRRQVDAVVLTSASCTENLVEQATVDASLDQLLNAVVENVLVVCLGPLAAQPLVERGVPVIVAPRPYVDDLVATVAQELPRRALYLVLDGRRIQLRGQALVVGDVLVPIQPGPVAVLRALARRPGRVLSAAEIRTHVPGWSDVDDHAIEMAVSRLRRCLDGTELDGLGLVQTVVKRGYRLAI